MELDAKRCLTKAKGYIPKMGGSQGDLKITEIENKIHSLI